jgi:hypothetical protein
MAGRDHPLRQREESLRFRIHSLSGLRRLVALPPACDVAERQWSLLEPQLAAAAARLTTRVRQAAEWGLPRVHDAGAARRLNAVLGEIELDLSRAFAFFDTYMDVLTQRRSPELGAVLAGCDVLAREAMTRAHPALRLVEPPLVYCDRGVGASIMRESVPFPDGSPNPMPLIQIPYARLKQKYNLTSIPHEAGHQGLARMNLVGVLPRAFRAALARAGAPAEIRDLYALWAFEIGPDFWAFCLTGAAEANALRDLFALPPAHALRIAFADPHPPPYLRALLAFAWCRQMWGRGPWDAWEAEWIALYPLRAATPETRRLLIKARTYLPLIGDVLFHTRFAALGGRTLPDLFDLAAVAPSTLERVAAGAATGRLRLGGLPACAQLAVFHVVRESGRLDEAGLDRLMTTWLLELGAQRRRAA